MHPLQPDLSEVPMDELHQKANDLQKRISAAYRMSSYDAVQQLQMFLSGYMAEIQRRNEKIMSEMSEKSSEFKHIIDIK
jgi:hypothetical protein